jgi:hypothetical protein
MSAFNRIAITCLCILLITILSKSLLAQPVITGFSPASGPVGSTVTITGSGFDNSLANNVVYFGAVKATITAASNNSLTVTVPGGATYEPITVTSNNLTGYSNKPFNTTFGGVINQSSTTSFSQAIDIQARRTPYDFAMADLNDDGKADFVGVGDFQLFTVMQNNSTTDKFSFLEHTFDPRISGSFLALGDLDGNGKTDVVVGSYNAAVVMKNTSSGGNFTFSFDYAFSGIGSSAAQL